MILANSTFNLLQVADNLFLSPEGIWTPPQHIDYKFLPDDETDWFQVEEQSFWYRHRNACFIEILQNFSPSGILFEIGSGNGFVSRALQSAGFPVVAIEPDIKWARNAKSRGVNNVVCSTIEEAHFRERSMPAAALFDILEHIEDELAFLSQVNHLLKPGGLCYLAVPAYYWLWSREDETAGHRRRYSLQSLRSIAQKAGFSVEYETYYFQPLVLPIALFRALPSRLGLRKPRTHDLSTREHNPHLGIRICMDYFFRCELQSIRARRKINYGTSCLIVAKSGKHNF